MLYARLAPRGLALKINAQRLSPSDKFMGVFQDPDKSTH